MSRDLNLLSANFKPKVELFLAEAKKQGLDIFITETGRTKERQQELYNQGRTTPGRIVTWTLNSKHLIPSEAFDIAFNKPTLYPKDMNLWNKLIEIAKSFGIDNGFTLWGKDIVHFQDNGEIPDEELLKSYVMTPEQQQALQTIEFACKNLYNIAELQGGNKELQEFAGSTAAKSRELNT